MNFVRSSMRWALKSLLVIVVLASFASVSAQETVPILILPVDQAQFLPGATFDFRVEAHADALPDDFSVTVNGTDAITLFGVEPSAESWVFGSNDTPVQSWVWRNLTAPSPGDYVVEVTAGGNTTSVTWTVRQPSTERAAQNIILFVADGMSIATISAARLARGMNEGTPLNPLTIDTAEFVGLARTSSVDSPMVDSANSASALNTGHIGSINATGIYADTSPDTLDDPRVETFASLVSRIYDMSVGVVTTADFSDATPASVFAHGRNRSDLNRNTYLVQALEGGYVDVLLGGGARRMIPQGVEGSRRADDRDLYVEYEAAGFTVATTATELNEVVANGANRLLGVFHPSDLNVWLDRNVYTDNLGSFTDQPGLVDMTLAALEVLNQNENGFYLEVEAASVDKQLHPLDQERALSDLIEFDQAIAAAAAWVAENAPDTLIVVTADHAHGYEVYGTVNVADFNAAADDAGRRDAIGIYADADYPNYPDADGNGYPDWADATVVLAGNVNNGPDRTENFQVSPVPRAPAIDDGTGVWVSNPDDDPNGITITGNIPVSAGNSGVHTLQDVPVFGWGPGADRISGLYHQREVFFIMAAALGLNPADAS